MNEVDFMGKRFIKILLVMMDKFLGINPYEWKATAQICLNKMYAAHGLVKRVRVCCCIAPEISLEKTLTKNNPSDNLFNWFIVIFVKHDKC